MVLEANDRELIDACRQGDADAFRTLFEIYKDRVYSIALRYSGDANIAMDIAQETFLKVLSAIRDFRKQADIETWLYRITVRQALNHRRWWWRHLRQQVSIDAADEGNRIFLDLKDTEATPFDSAAAREVLATVRQALAQVPALFRSAVILRDMEGFSYEEIAEVLDISVGTVKSRILRGRRMLKEILEPLVRAPQLPAASGTRKHAGHMTSACLRYMPASAAPVMARAASGGIGRTQGGAR
jgi:RNA polymerase sigma-70 factor, ECF subfamily